MIRLIIETTKEMRKKLKSEAAKRDISLKEFMLMAALEKIEREKND